ncbi:MAG: enoyl-CoA hydratase/isomerase family protein [Halioglobus sp.]|nr:enoyl-CoA hydratase/isomerase family protein [Halioglobus sp.]
MDYSKFGDQHHLEVCITDRVATVTLDRPTVHNAVNHAVHVGLETIFRALSVDPDVGAIVLTGKGTSFCAGGDVKDFGNPDDRPIDQLRGTRYLVQEMVTCEAPIIAAVNGTAAGLGATIALLSDVIFIADSARIGDTHVKMGLAAGDGGTVIWPLLIGPHRAKELLMTGKLVTGAEAAEMGLVNHCVPHDALMEQAMRYAREVAHGPIAAVRWTKMAINQQIQHSINMTMNFSAAAEHLTAHTEDMREAVTAFAEKRTPKFSGH